MKVSDLKPGQLDVEMKKTIRVKALGEKDIYVGYYNHLRRRGGDIFIVRPIVRERRYISGTQNDPRTGKEIKKYKTEKTLITAQQQISDKWMVVVKPGKEETQPVHFNEAGRGRKRLNIPGMTSKVGLEDNEVNVEPEQKESVPSEENVI